MQRGIGCSPPIVHQSHNAHRTNSGRNWFNRVHAYFRSDKVHITGKMSFAVGTNNMTTSVKLANTVVDELKFTVDLE
jgi:hypothetical protein